MNHSLPQEIALRKKKINALFLYREKNIELFWHGAVNDPSQLQTTIAIDPNHYTLCLFCVPVGSLHTLSLPLFRFCFFFSQK
jgi:hypothetical protein